jgi:hypothetical protein
MKDPIKFMEQYAKWNEEAKAELKQLLINGKLGNPEREDFNEIKFNDEGLVYQNRMNHVAGNVRTKGETKVIYGNLITPWKDSKYYYEM